MIKKKNLLKEFFVTAVWGLSGFFVLEYATRIGNLPYAFRELLYDKIYLYKYLKLTHIFIELHFFKFLFVFLTILILSILTAATVTRMIFFLTTYNYSLLFAVYQFYFLRKWDHYSRESIEYFIGASFPLIIIFSIIVAILGCMLGTFFRKKLLKLYKNNPSFEGASSTQKNTITTKKPTT